MKLRVKQFDGRSRSIEYVIDIETGKKVGFCQSHAVGFGNSGGIDISLFDNKYTATVNTFKECLGFVKGVECVLNHVTQFTDHTKQAFVAA
jgi:hypothetical protein